MLLDAFLKLHDDIQHGKLGANKKALQAEQEAAARTAAPTLEMKGLLR
jgi:NADH-quinone oxidoreductase subunit B